jgi:hypothetical protein
VADIMNILQSNYTTVGKTVPSNVKYVAVDPRLYEGTWNGTYSDKKSFKITVSDVSGFHAKVQYRSAGTVQSQNVLIRGGSFRVGDTKFSLTKVGSAQIKNVVTDPQTGSTFLDTAVATQEQ